MKWNDLASEQCSLARALSVVGDRWTLLILREAFFDVRRFDEMQQRLGIARRVLTDRLSGLVADGILVKVAYQERPARSEYRLTEKGRDLFPIVVALVHWGDRHLADSSGPPIIHRHTACGQDFTASVTCSECGEPVHSGNVETRRSR